MQSESSKVWHFRFILPQNGIWTKTSSLRIVNVRGFPPQNVANLFQMTSNRKWLIKRGKSWWHCIDLMWTLSFSIPPFSAMILGTWTTWLFRTWDIAAYHAHSTCFQARQKVWLVKRVDFDELQTSWRRFFWRFLPLDLNCGNADFRPGGQLFTWTMANAGSFAWQSNNKRKYITLDYEEEFELSPRKGRVCWFNR